MKDFRLYDIMDFVMDEDFIRWVQEKQPDDEAYWNNWLKSYPEKHLLVAEARRILESIRIEQKVFTPEEIDQEAGRLLQTINGQSLQDRPRAPMQRISTRQWIAAAVLAGIIVTGVRYFPFGKAGENRIDAESYSYSKLTAERSLVEQVNTSDKPINIMLADSSIVELSVNSRISYPRSFDSARTRDVYLSGEAFFKVTKNPNMPFRVFSNELVTKVLGTSFKVRSFERDSVIQVVVKTGKVSVYSQAKTTVQETSTPDKLGGIILTPNQQLTYRKEGQQFQKILLEKPSMIVPVVVDRNMVYEDTRVEEVFDQISKAYGINIVYDLELLKNCTVTADLRNESFYDKLDLLCRAIGAGYEVIDGQVVIQSSGCQ
jgi:ferric-dicitrate binding protein FerR (iron transport regulator)